LNKETLKEETLRSLQRRAGWPELRGEARVSRRDLADSLLVRLLSKLKEGSLFKLREGTVTVLAAEVLAGTRALGFLHGLKVARNSP